MSTAADYYELLGVAPNADEKQIREAYIRQSLRWHPDLDSSAEASENFRQITEAYYVLSDKEKRRRYDQSRASRRGFTLDGSIQTNQVFGQAFDELFQPENENASPFWQRLGGAAGACLGFIVFNVPGAVAGFVAGSKLGQIRDAKGVCVYEAFCKLEPVQRTSVLRELAAKMITTL